LGTEKRSSRQTGAKYEEYAVKYLETHGYRILERNYRNVCGEIDIIATDTEDFTVVYFEVKYRGSEKYGDPLEAVDMRKQRRIGRAAALHFGSYGAKKGLGCRFDVIGVYEDGKLSHIKNAFGYYE